MLAKRTLSTLSVYERQALQLQWLRSGKCHRCFHASLRTRAEEAAEAEGKAKKTRVNGKMILRYIQTLKSD